ncbi:hypothetical protein ABT246_15910 [Streptomyces sp. NPDC001553]|uniref:hypothetical protein n=1 Tax=Streptomyces sp. NPDC001553 TaxID=3154385 RepID=UPI00331D6269
MTGPGECRSDLDDGGDGNGGDGNDGDGNDGDDGGDGGDGHRYRPPHLAISPALAA